MIQRKLIGVAVLGSLVLGPVVGCESLPGNEKQQGAVVGGVGGAAAGALIAKDNRLLGGLIGGALGAGGGYLVGANWDKISGNKKDDAVAASKKAEKSPARADDVRNSVTADLNRDGFVTLDEIVAMQDAGLADQEMISRLQSTGQVFELTDSQQAYLRERGVDRGVLDAMLDMNRNHSRTASARDPAAGSDRIGQERGSNAR